MQEYILQECDLLPRIATTVVALDAAGVKGRARPPLMGHLIHIAQAIVLIGTPSYPEGVDSASALEPAVVSADG
jgi:hypothetical protein